MQSYVNASTQQFTRALGLNTVLRTATFKARDTGPFEVWFHQDGVGYALEAGALIIFAIKSEAGTGGTLYAKAEDFEVVDAVNKPGLYRSLLSLNTEAIVDGLESATSLEAVGEVTWSEDAGDTWQSSSTLILTIEEDVWTGNEGTPLEMDTPEEWLEGLRPAPLELTEELPQDGTDSLVLSGVTSPGSMNLTWIPGAVVNGKQSFTIDGAAETTDVVWTGTEWRIRRNFLVEGLTTLFTSTQNVASPDFVTAWTATADATGAPVFTADAGTVATTLDQTCIVSHSDGTFSRWSAVQLTPVRWLPTSAGIIWNEDDSEWNRLTFDSGTLDYATLPDQ